MSLSNNIRNRMAEGSWVRKMFEEGTLLKQKHGPENVFDLSIGNPVMEPPTEFEVLLKSLADHPMPGMHRYMSNAGYPETRSEVAVRLSSEADLHFTMDDIVMTCGAAGALNVVLKTILNPQDEVIVFAPYFVEYDNYIDNHGGIVRALPTNHAFVPDLGALEAAISLKTKAVLINSPNNPTGVVYAVGLIEQLTDVLKKKEAEYGHHIYLLSDEPYRKIIYDGLRYPPVFPHYLDSIMMHSHSKDLALPGERIGYIALHPDCNDHDELMSGFIFSNRILGFVNAPALMQHIVRNLQDVTIPVAEYQQKRDFLYANLIDMGYSLVKPQGAFYMFPKSPIDDDVQFVGELQKSNLLTVPGRGFGLPGYIRISYCVDDQTLVGALTGFRNAARKNGLS